MLYSRNKFLSISFLEYDVLANAKRPIDLHFVKKKKIITQPSTCKSREKKRYAREDAERLYSIQISRANIARSLPRAKWNLTCKVKSNFACASGDIMHRDFAGIRSERLAEEGGRTTDSNTHIWRVVCTARDGNKPQTREREREAKDVFFHKPCRRARISERKFIVRAKSIEKHPSVARVLYNYVAQLRLI